jgi:hypothetical protein
VDFPEAMFCDLKADAESTGRWGSLVSGASPKSSLRDKMLAGVSRQSHQGTERSERYPSRGRLSLRCDDDPIIAAFTLHTSQAMRAAEWMADWFEEARMTDQLQL